MGSWVLKGHSCSREASLQECRQNELQVVAEGKLEMELADLVDAWDGQGEEWEGRRMGRPAFAWLCSLRKAETTGYRVSPHPDLVAHTNCPLSLAVPGSCLCYLGRKGNPSQRMTENLILFKEYNLMPVEMFLCQQTSSTQSRSLCDPRIYFHHS